jgi:TPR repeat protein
MYYEGRGVPRDYAEALRWHRKAADQSNAGAQLNLGLIYVYGQGVPQSHVQAYMWFNLAEANPRADKETRDQAVKNRNLVATLMTPAQIEEAQALAGDWNPSNDR